ncbi:hypothetical protein TNCV_3556841 [Trichonephila clavipes]|uniref:Alpha-carbonic anhydrase domain-containing protein n=1 Tax=Trichonephila clavipes TaxID=2585209 RepID=A0A8X7BHR1_TRICX|nr:hypothetical protein TNCV_3556841 [Trichonephila clavipes]
MTYEGSTTMPGCHETVTWILLNRPIYITKSELKLIINMQMGSQKSLDSRGCNLELNQVPALSIVAYLLFPINAQSPTAI